MKALSLGLRSSIRSRQPRVNSTGEIFFARICSEACRSVHCAGEAARLATGAASKTASTSLRVGEAIDMAAIFAHVKKAMEGSDSLGKEPRGRIRYFWL